MQRKYLYYTILFFLACIGLWVIPSFVKMATYSPDSYPFVYYSAIMEDWGIVNYKDKEMPLTDLRGNKYMTFQFDSLMPLLNYRQLISDGRLPDSIHGVAITPPLLQASSILFRYAPQERNTPEPELYILFESISKRIGLEMPEDVFRLKNKIEFIDVQSNTIKKEKSLVFAQAFEKAGYSFPSQWTRGNPNPRKAYDEGYFSLDSRGRLYHIKMVNGTPYVRDTHLSDKIDVAWFSMYEALDKRFCGFLFDKQGSLYIVESNEGKYASVKLDMDPIDINRNHVMIMGNLLYWTVLTTTSEGRKYYGLETSTLKRVARHEIDRQPNTWDHLSKWMFPFYLTFYDQNSNYLHPQIHFTGIYGAVINLLLAVLAGILFSGKRNQKITNMLFVALTGIAGMSALLLMSRKN